MRRLWARLQGLCSGIPFSPGEGGRTGAVDATAQPPRVGTPCWPRNSEEVNYRPSLTFRKLYPDRLHCAHHAIYNNLGCLK